MDRRDRSAHVWDGHEAPLARRYGSLIGLTLIPLAAACAGVVLPAGIADLGAAIAFMLAGAALLVGWKVNGWAYCGWLGCAGLALGVLSIADHAMFGPPDSGGGLAGPLGSVLVTTVAVTLIVSALRAPDVDSGMRPLRVLAIGLGSGLIGLLALERLIASAVGGLDASRVMSAECAVVWLAAGMCGLCGSTARRNRPWVHVAAGIVIVEAIAHSIGAAANSSTANALSLRVGDLTAASLAVLVSVHLLTRILDGQDRYQFALHIDLDVARERVRQDRAELDERLHDLRNAVTAVRTADAALRRCRTELDDETGEYLAEAITAELSRLHTLVTPERSLETEEVRLGQALAPVIAMARASDMLLDVDLGPEVALGDPDATARIVQNLLVNARLYAPGSPVSIVSRSVGDRVELRVSDRGHGVPEAEQASLFQRGFRGGAAAGADGSGVGLFVASGLAAAMQGRLRLDPAGPGATFVLELPAATAL
jgi:signal transduction histidine kinase